MLSGFRFTNSTKVVAPNAIVRPNAKITHPQLSNFNFIRTNSLQRQNTSIFQPFKLFNNYHTVLDCKNSLKLTTKITNPLLRNFQLPPNRLLWGRKSKPETKETTPPPPSPTEEKVVAEVKETKVEEKPKDPPKPVPKIDVPNRLTEPCFAVVHLSGAQHKVHPGDVLFTEKLEAEVGSNIILDKVLLIGTKEWTAIGTPMLDNAKVYATVEEHSLGEKTIIFKKKRRKNYRRLTGHRQQLTTLRILDVSYVQH